MSLLAPRKLVSRLLLLALAAAALHIGGVQSMEQDLTHLLFIEAQQPRHNPISTSYFLDGVLIVMFVCVSVGIALCTGGVILVLALQHKTEKKHVLMRNLAIAEPYVPMDSDDE